MTAVELVDDVSLRIKVGDIVAGTNKEPIVSAAAS